MTVYKGYMKIVKQNKVLILIYLVIFFSVTMLFQGAAGKELPDNYHAESLKIGIVDKSGGQIVSRPEILSGTFSSGDHAR